MKQQICVLFLLIALLPACNLTPLNPDGNAPASETTVPEMQTIVGAHIEGPPQFYPRSGDIWQTTWADDDNVYLSWGDGTGRRDCCGTLDPTVMGGACNAIPSSVSLLEAAFELTTDQCQAENYCFCDWTDAGLGILRGTIKESDLCQAECIVSLNIPSGLRIDPAMQTPRNSKPSSLLFYNGRLYWAGIYQIADWPDADGLSPDYGYIAFSDDYGQTWTEVENSPWSPENESHFAQIMFINMGQAYRLNNDGYVYALAKDFGAWSFVEGSQEYSSNFDVYLSRVPRDRYVTTEGVEVDPILDYSAYEYYTGMDGSGDPIWSPLQAEAIPLAGLKSLDKGGVMYHPGTGNYIFLTARPSGLFVAPHPWGPWRLITDLLSDFALMDPELGPEGWTGGGYIPGLIAKDTGPDSLYFTISGVGGAEHYQLTIGQIVLEVSENP